MFRGDKCTHSILTRSLMFVMLYGKPLRADLASGSVMGVQATGDTRGYAWRRGATQGTGVLSKAGG